MKTWRTITIVALALACTVEASPQSRRRLRVRGQHTTGAPGVLTMADLSCAGMFIGPAFTTGSLSTSFPVAPRRVSNTRHYFTYNGDGEVYEFTEPAPDTWSACNSAFSSLTPVGNGSLTDWGAFSAASS